MPLTFSSTGRLFASYQSDTIIKPLVLAEWQKDTHNLTAAPISISKLTETELDAKWQNFTELQTDIRSQGYATVIDVMLVGINAISIPVILPKSKQSNDRPSSNKNISLEYALTIIGTAEQLPVDNRQVIKTILSIAKRYQIA